jgi:hypothetical protein
MTAQRLGIVQLTRLTLATESVSPGNRHGRQEQLIRLQVQPADQPS